MAQLPGEIAVRGGIIDVFSPEAARPVRIELFGDSVDSVREFDPRTQRSIAPVQRTTLLPLMEWAVPPPEKTDLNASAWETPSFFGPTAEPGPSTLFELPESSLRPMDFLDEPHMLREAATKHLPAATENYQRHGRANSPAASHYFWSEEEFAAALEKTSQIQIEQLGLTIGSIRQFELSSRPTSGFHGDVVACRGDVKSQLAS